jgi:hypothetical protein
LPSIFLRHGSADGNVLRVSFQPGRQHTLGLEKISRVVVELRQSDCQAVIGRSGCSCLFEHRERIRKPPGLFVKLGRYKVISVVIRIARGQGVRFRYRCIRTIYLPFDPDQIGLQGGVLWVVRDGFLQHPPGFGEIFRAAECGEIAR